MKLPNISQTLALCAGSFGFSLTEANAFLQHIILLAGTILAIVKLIDQIRTGKPDQTPNQKEKDNGRISNQ